MATNKLTLLNRLRVKKLSSEKNLITVSSLSFSYGENTVLKNISFEIKEKDFVAIIGPNGSGKTTLIKIMLNLLEAGEGNVKLSVPKERIGYVPQRYTIDKNFPGTVEEILSVNNNDNNNNNIKQAGIVDLLKKKFVSLSGGQQQRVLIALALEKNPKLLILDEPTAGVDIKAQQSFYDLLKELNKKGITIILVTHEVGVVSSLVKKVLCINHKICCMGKPKEIPKLLKQMYGEHFIHHHHGHDQNIDHKQVHTDKHDYKNRGHKHD